MAGPVIITDDGGPPLYNLDKTSGEFRMKTGRLDEDMPQLLKANSPHTLKDASAISRVEVSQGGESKLVAYSPKMVTVTSGESKDTIVVETVDTGSVTIQSVQALTDVSEMPWGVYATVQMGYISVIQIDNIIVTTGGDSTRVSVYLS